MTISKIWLTYYSYIDIINLIELLKGVTALENQYLTKKAAHKSLLLFAVLTAIEIASSVIIPAYLNFYFCAIAFLLVIIPVFYKQLGIKKNIAYSALSMALITAFVYIINLNVLILLPLRFDFIFGSRYTLVLTRTLLQTAALFLSLLISFKLITRSIKIIVKYNFLMFVILAVYLTLEFIINYLGDKALS